MRELKAANRKSKRIVALDGEGWTRKSDGAHLYTYLAACDADGLVSCVEDKQGLTTKAVFEWLLDLPGNALLVGYSLGYDRTKWLQDMPDGAIYALTHPDARVGTHGPLPIGWAGYKLNLVSTRFSIARLEGPPRQRTVWDVWRFFQSSFVKALRAWSVGSEKEVDAIERMKLKRGNFQGISQKEQAYCQSECMLLAKLVSELIEAHEDEGLHLKSYFGPGSTAGIVLKKCGADVQRVELGPEIVDGVSSAYFGGRFECSHVGPIAKPLWGYDIASAYPYALAKIPCLAHGTWKAVHGAAIWDAVQGDAPALISYRIEPSSHQCEAWGPLPHRLPDGNIVFPIQSAGGWAWNWEVKEAIKLHSGIMCLAAWQWCQDCDHPPPFREEIVSLFTRRLAWGKAARGIVLKLALNSMYGKSAQHVGGGGRFRCMVRAGLVTAHTRAQLLQAIQRARDPWSILELATDSVLSLEPLELPQPAPLGTLEAATRAGKVELGGWEGKAWEGGAMLLRPGLRFALGEDSKMGHTAARGLGVRTLHSNRAKVLRAWEREPMAPTTVQQPTMFHGAKSSVRMYVTDDLEMPFRYVRDELYGRWEDPVPRILSYHPGPKRCAIAPSPHGSALRLLPWELPMTRDARSVPYLAAEEDDRERMLFEEQPEAGYLDCF